MIFEPYKLKNITLRNRVVMAPMTRNQSPGGIPTQDVVSYYSRRSKAEVGLIITEGIEVSHKASSAYPNVPRLDSESMLPDQHLTDWNHYMIFKHRTDL